MDSYPNPYAALIATFNQVSPLESKDDPDDPQHLPDDDLLLWANAQFTYDIPPGVGIYEDEMGVKLAMSQQQQQQQQPSHSIITSQPQQQHPLQYQSADIQRQLQQLDAIHRYLDASSEADPRTSLSVVERSRQRNPVITAGPSQPPVHFNSVYPQAHVEVSSSSSFSTPGPANPISRAAARLLRQPFLALQQQQHQPYSVGASPLSSPTTMTDLRQLQINPQSPISPKPSDDVLTTRGVALKEVTSTSSPANSSRSATTIASSSLSSSEEKLNRADSDDEDYEHDQDEENHLRSSGSMGASKIALAAQGLTPDDPEYASKLAAEDDKRRRNTAASARFRHKKRLREQVLEKTAKEMTAKSELLEVRVRELEMEIKWLRGLIVEKDSRMLDVGVSSSAALSLTTSSSSSLSAASSVLSNTLSGSLSLASAKGSSKAESASSKKRGKKAKV
ncbi:hypothetical protein BGZ99_005949 [Dissophora globulifera]|uniref:BZIP domain-containing protein n=1 Tax=Dissophora globulifera TaxID=979702 RepID=A0A9P6RDQ5_9FUNG|nr:hypothetical protein BGZ99_005949 [Dissophora globulifera]